jgi:hypothetical protein
MTDYLQIFAALAAPFRGSEIKARPQGNRQLQYITARTVMNRLDEVLGPERWWDEYQPLEHSVICRLSIRLPDGSVLTKSDAGGYAGMTDQGDDDKSGFSDAFKRAAVKFGIGRHLYGDGVANLRGATAEPAAPPGRLAKVAAPAPAAAHHAINHDNGTGHGSGAYAEPEVVKAYKEFIETVVSEINMKWLDRITDPKSGEMLSSEGEVVRTWGLSGHLLKWAKSMGWVKAPQDVRPDQRDKFAAVAWKDHMSEYHEEARRYFKREWNAGLKRIKAPKPATKRDNDAEEVAAENAAMDALLTTEAGARG